MDDTVNAFVEMFTVAGASQGPLAGLTFAAKDLYDVVGHTTGCGNPDWAASHDVATHTASAVQKLLEGGATLLGKTHTDEIAYSLMGINAFYGTPINCAAPDRVPGGSSSGSVAATAAGLVDIGLGTDTGGSVRMPASFSGVFGIRTTHGRVDLSGTMALAPSFDTVGWFTRDADIFAHVGAAFDMQMPIGSIKARLMIADDAMALTVPEFPDVMGSVMAALQDRLGPVHRVQLAAGGLADWSETFRICQGGEVWQEHGAWVTKTQPKFGPGVKERFQMAAAITPGMFRSAQIKRTEISARLVNMLGDDGIMVLPSSPGPAPFRNATKGALDTFRGAALKMLCPAGLAGLPQVSIPVGTIDGGPVGLSLIAAPGRDGDLLDLANRICTEI